MVLVRETGLYFPASLTHMFPFLFVQIAAMTVCMATCGIFPCVKHTLNILLRISLSCNFTQKYRLFHGKQAVPEWKQPASLCFHTKIVPCCAIATKYKNGTYTSVLHLLVTT